MTQAFIFPGQGSQAVGMGKDLAENFAPARDVFAVIDDALGERLTDIMWNGPEDELTLTQNTQPALMAVSVAVLRVLEAEGFVLAERVSHVAGHSLGEYAALVANGVLDLSDAARLLRLRGQAMQRAVPVGVGAMAALLGLEFDQADAIARQAAGDEVCSAANDNANGQVVISGHAGAVARAIDLAKEAGAKRAIELPVSAPFHCALMQPAAEEMAAALADTRFNAPSVPVVCNVTAAAENDPEKLRANLVQQVTGVVRWRESVSWMAAQGVTQMVELGAGKVLTGMVKRIEKDVAASALNNADDITDFLA